jgi:hypothetical protein
MKTFLLICFALCFSAIVFGQDANPSIQRTAASPVEFGLKAGVNLANIKSEIYSNTKSRVGFYAGGLAHIHLNQNLALQPEIVYSSQGLKQNISSGLELNLKTDYLNIPVVFQYMNSGFRLETGPQVGFLLNAKAKYTDNRTDVDVTNNFKSVDFSWVFGTSYFSEMGLGIGARYNLGITNVNEDITAPGVTNTEMNHRVWHLGLFYQFGR